MSKGFDLAKDLKALVGSYLAQEDVSIAKWQIYEDVCAFAAGAGYLNILKDLRNKGYSLNGDICDFAAGGGQLDVLKYLSTNSRREPLGGGFFWGVNIFLSAASNGHLNVLKYLYNNGCPPKGPLRGWSTHACAGAAYGGHLDVLKYLHGTNCMWNASACAFANSRRAYGGSEVLARKRVPPGV